MKFVIQIELQPILKWWLVSIYHFNLAIIPLKCNGPRALSKM